MSKRDLYDDSQPIRHSGNAMSDHMSDSLSDLFDSVDLSEYEFEDDNTTVSAPQQAKPPIEAPEEAQKPIEEDIPEEPAPDAAPEFHLGNYTDYDNYTDSGTYRSYNGSSEYRSFDAAMPDAPEEGWYHYSQEDSDLEDEDEDYDYDDYDDEDEDDEDDAPPRTHRKLRIFSRILLGVITAMAAFYLMVLYAPIPVLTDLRDTYIRTAMSTLHHKWLATAIIPSEIIDQVMLEDFAADDAMVGVRSDWGNVNVEKVPTFGDAGQSLGPCHSPGLCGQHRTDSAQLPL